MGLTPPLLIMHPVFKNVHYITTLFYATPEGVEVTIHPGDYVIGEYFVHLEKPGLFERVTDQTEITLLLQTNPMTLKYVQKK